MKQLSLITFGLLLCATSAQAACFADYKAKQDDPLRLHYGVAEISGDCSVSNAESELRDRLSGNGWELLNVLAVFDNAGLEGRKGEAGEYYLRY